MAPMSHDLIDFMTAAGRTMAEEYERIRKRATEDPGTAGDQGEENWAELLRNWLPSHYRVVTKGRILGINGTASPQVDVIVLHPAYPLALVNKKLYLAGGVAAAFECKLTLKAGHVTEAVKTGAAVKALCPTREGTPYRELHAPIVYGLLAHSHSWKGAASAPSENISSALAAADASAVDHPRHMLDLLCVADHGCWNTIKKTFIGPSSSTGLDAHDSGVRSDRRCGNRLCRPHAAVSQPVAVVHARRSAGEQPVAEARVGAS